MKMKYLSTVLSLLLFTVVFSLPAKAADCGGADQKPCAVPEPSSLGILALGLVGLAASRIKKK
jgi:hypothetical protein